VRNSVRLTSFGEIVKSEWLKTEEIRPNIKMDEFVVMPNHFHGIILIQEVDSSVGAHRNAPQPRPKKPQFEEFGKSTKNSIPTIVKLFKATVTKQINELRQTAGKPVWQRNYFERVVRNEKELNRIREYIQNNPTKWAEDRENPKFKTEEIF